MAALVITLTSAPIAGSGSLTELSSAIVSKIRIDGVLSGIHRTFIKADGQKKERRILGKVKTVAFKSRKQMTELGSAKASKTLSPRADQFGADNVFYRAAPNANNLQGKSPKVRESLQSCQTSTAQALVGGAPMNWQRKPAEWDGAFSSTI